jgi:murein DD-endopeptidase MepM/ murein hydrolase activator NlpD
MSSHPFWCRRIEAAGFAVAVLLAAGCGDSGTDPAAGGPASLTLSLPLVEMFTGEREVLTARVLDAQGTQLDVAVTWSSSDPGVVTVDTDGAVVALAPGQVTVQARVDGLVAEADVTVFAPLGLTFPMDAVLNTDVFYVNYVDLDAGPGIRDYACGPKSYDGHRGVDLTLPSFDRMDAGVTVRASAPGTVSHVTDGIFDRSTENGPGGFGNHVILSHRDGFETIYGHLAKGSIQVGVGDGVGAGDALGRVGSSGNSDMPHLHLELRREGAVVPPFAGSCRERADHWAAPDPYQRSRALIQSGLTTQPMDLDLAKQPAAPTDTVRTTDSRITAWVHLADVEAGSPSRFDFVDPSGRLFWRYEFQHDRFFAMSWWWAWHGVGGVMSEIGTWRVLFFNRGEQLAEHRFELVDGEGSAGVPSGPSLEAKGGGGGGVRGDGG